jgi:hypothetical protein
MVTPRYYTGVHYVKTIGGEKMMLERLLPDIRELIDLVRETERFHAIRQDYLLRSAPINMGPGAEEEYQRKCARIAQIRSHWGI